MKACTPWVLLCVLVILILILAALLINNFTGAAAVAAIGGAALSKKRKRAKEIFGGDVKDFWNVKTDKLRPKDQTFARNFFPELQTTNIPNLVTDWVAIRDAFKKLSNDLDAAFYADKSYGWTKGTGRVLGFSGMDSTMARRGILGPTGTRIIGSWAQTYNAFDGVLVYLGDLVDLYRKNGPSLADVTTTFPAIRGDLTLYFGRIKAEMRPAVPEQATVMASVTELENHVGALPPPVNYAVTYPLFPSAIAAMDPAVIKKDGIANNQTAIAMTTVIGLRDAYEAAYNAWKANRAALTETKMIKNWDNLFKECEDKTVAIINHFTKSKLPTVTVDCNNDKIQLITAVKKLLDLSPKKTIWRMILGGPELLITLSNAAKNLALCISPLPVRTAMDPAAITKDGIANGHSALAMKTVITLLTYHNAAYNAWVANRAASTDILELDSRDFLFKECENKVVSIINHFTTGRAASPAVTKACNDDRTELITAAENLLGLSSKKGFWGKIFGGSASLPNLINAAKNLAFCLPPFPIFVSTMIPPHHEHIVGFASTDPAIITKYRERVTLPTEGYHSGVEYTAIKDLNVNYYKFLTWWANARVNPNTYKLAVKDIATALELQTFMEAIGEAINGELDESYFEKPAVIAPNKWNKTTSEKCAAAILKLKALVTAVNTKITITTPGRMYGTSPQPDWANFRTALTKVPDIDFVIFKRPATTSADDVFDRPPLTPSQRLIKYKFTPDVEAKFVKEVIPGAHGALVLEASSIEELDAKLARIPESKARIYGLVVDKPGDLVALYKAVAINIGNRMSVELETKQANVANAATGRLYTTTWMPNIGSSGRGAYYKEYRDLIKPALYAVT